MAFREVRLYEVREVLRLWLDGEGLRSIERLSQVGRRTVRRYVTAATELGLVRDGGADQLSDEFIAAVVEVVRPHRSDGHGDSWQQLVAEHDTMTGWVTDGLTGVKIHELLARRGVRVPLRTATSWQMHVSSTSCSRPVGARASEQMWSCIVCRKRMPRCSSGSAERHAHSS